MGEGCAKGFVAFVCFPLSRLGGHTHAGTHNWKLSFTHKHTIAQSHAHTRTQARTSGNVVAAGYCFLNGFACLAFSFFIFFSLLQHTLTHAAC